MRFQAEGTFEVEITETGIADSKFAPAPAFDVCLKVRDEDGHEDWWRGEVSKNYGKGNFADRTQARITMDVLAEIGYEHGQDLSQLDTLVGVRAFATVAASTKNDKTYYNVRYLGNGGSGGVSKLAPEELKSRMAALFGDGSQGEAAPSVGSVGGSSSTSTTFGGTNAKKNPFAK